MHTMIWRKKAWGYLSQSVDSCSLSLVIVLMHVDIVYHILLHILYILCWTVVKKVFRLDEFFILVTDSPLAPPRVPALRFWSQHPPAACPHRTGYLGMPGSVPAAYHSRCASISICMQTYESISVWMNIFFSKTQPKTSFIDSLCYEFLALSAKLWGRNTIHRTQ